MAEKHPIHDYTKDGDIIRKVENTHFLVHKSILSLASEFFNDLFTLATPNSNEIIKNTTVNESEGSILILEIVEEDVTSIQDMLSFIYPNTILHINWKNVENLLRIADKFVINKLSDACDFFLQNNVVDNVLTSFILADQYRLPIPFKESSKLILNDYFKYEIDSKFKRISKETREKLEDSCYFFHTALNKIHFYFGNDDYNNYYLNNAVQKVCVYPAPNPSVVYSEFSSIQILLFSSKRPKA
ncbi:10038_t:CDS:1 [Funneliformis caledonium]|uniref:10038_t:CDS:1 n=1 Tax=Funneliformis caledonium TaxID=1117310 RepID=A0A9N9GBG3_9GLOM|nr:10038_t:CDS:1 [Funneliformis caledonium]